MTVKSPETLNLIPMAFSLLEENLSSYNNHNHMSIMAEESLTKQYCTIIQNTVREGLKKRKKKLEIFPKGGGVPSDFGSVSQLFNLFLYMV